MIAMLQEIKYRRDKISSENKEIGCKYVVLYFGCHSNSVDYIYKDELQNYVKCNILTELHTAFSLDSDNETDNISTTTTTSISNSTPINVLSHIHVQDLMKLNKNANSLVNMIVPKSNNDNNNTLGSVSANIYVCGSVAMGTAVLETFVDIVSEYRGIYITPSLA
jgi:sulfite reductase alpha subunit-like flavoprotein